MLGGSKQYKAWFWVFTASFFVTVFFGEVEPAFLICAVVAMATSDILKAMGK